jgi:hypothetical protein
MTSLTVTRGSRINRTFLRHLGEMLVAMVLGMVLFGPLWPYLFSDGLLARADVAAGTMATGMAVAMAFWMAHRGHGGAAVAEMSAAMYLPFLVLLVPWWAGLVPADLVLAGGHVLMLPAMVVAMLHRPAEYAGHRRHRTPTGVAGAVVRRWPTWFALLVTVDHMVDPRPLAAWTMLVMPVAYLGIGAVRRTLRPRPVLAAQVAGLVAYVLLVVAATLASGDLALVLIGSGWLAHAGWDAWHHRRGAVVPRGFAEWCGVLDVVIGLTVLAVALT